MFGRLTRVACMLSVVAASCLAPVVECCAEVANDKVRRVSDEVSKVGNAYGAACGKAINEFSEDNRREARLRYVDCLLVLHKYTYPAISLDAATDEKGEKLKLAYTEWLKKQQETMSSHGLEYINILEDPSLNGEQTREKLLELVKRQVEAETPFNQRLNEALKAYEEP